MSTGKTIALIKSIGGGNPGGTGTGLPSDVGPYKQMATDGEGKWVPVDRLGWKEIAKTEMFSGEVKMWQPGRFQGLTTSTDEIVVFGITQGEKYLVVWDGTQHECKAFSFSAGEIQYNGFGNPALIPTNIGDITVTEAENNLPFLFASYVVNNVEHTVVNLDNSDVHTAQIYKVAENLKKISPEYLPEGIGYKTVEETMIFPETSLSFVSRETENALYFGAATAPDGFVLTQGAKYDVTWDGTEYKGLVAFDDDGYTTIGSPYNSITDELPFDIYVDHGEVCVCTNSQAETHVLSIVWMVETTHPIPAEYLTNARFVVNVTMEDLSSFTADKTMEEVVAAHKAGMSVVAVLSINTNGVISDNVFPFTAYAEQDGNIMICNFGVISIASGGVVVSALNMTANGITYESASLAEKEQ